jgi:hypothetical protein
MHRCDSTKLWVNVPTLFDFDSLLANPGIGRLLGGEGALLKEYLVFVVLSHCKLLERRSTACLARRGCRSP